MPDVSKLEVYAIGALALILAFLGIYFYGHHEGFEEEKAAYDLFVSQTAALGKKATADADAQVARDKLAKEKADEDNLKRIADLDTTIKQLRAQHSGGSFLPAAASGSLRPDLACFDRTAYLAAFGEFVTEARGLVDEGAAATVDLDTAKLWAQGK